MILFWLGMFSAAALLAAGRGWLWSAKAAGVLALGGAGVLAAPLLAGWVVGAAWGVGIVLPAGFVRLAGRCTTALRFGPAAVLYGAAWALHPDPSYRLQAAILAALLRARQGDVADAAARLGRIARSPRTPRPMALSALMHLRRLEGRQDLLLEEVAWDAEPPAQAALTRISALAALGRRRELLSAWREALPLLHAARTEAPPVWALALLSLFVGTGRPAAVRRLLAGPLRGMPAGTRALYVALAQLAAEGQAEEARGALRRLTGARDQELALRAARALAVPPAPAALDVRDTALVDAAEAELDVELRARAARPRLLRSPVTLALILLNAAAFAAELLLGGSDDLPTLMRLGALWPPYMAGPGPDALTGQWWRVVTAGFLHFGWLHFGINMLALAALGTQAERRLGRWRMLATYAAAGTGAMAGIVLLVQAGWMRPEPVVGASAAIMGLVGAQVAAAAGAWRRSRSRETAFQLAWAVGLVALQTAIDVATPQISVAAHALGGAIGLLVAVVLGVAGPWGATGRTPARPDADTAAAPPANLPGTPLGTPAGQPTFRPRRQVLLGAAGGAVAVAGALAFPRRRDRAEAEAAARRQLDALSPAHLAAIRRLRFTFFAEIEAGAPAVDPWRPFGSADAFADLASATGVQGDAALRRLYVEVMRLLPAFCAHGRLAPGTYQVGRQAVSVSEEQVRLVPALSWRVPSFGDQAPVPRNGAWPVDAVDFKRPYGDMTYFEADMAEALGLPVGTDAEGRVHLPDDLLRRLDALHRSMATALQAFVLHAALDIS